MEKVFTHTHTHYTLHTIIFPRPAVMSCWFHYSPSPHQITHSVVPLCGVFPR